MNYDKHIVVSIALDSSFWYELSLKGDNFDRFFSHSFFPPSHPFLHTELELQPQGKDCNEELALLTWEFILWLAGDCVNMK